MKGNKIFLAACVIVGLFGILSLLLSMMSDTNNSEIQFNSDEYPKKEDGSYRDFVKKNYQVYSIEMPDTMEFSGEPVPLSNIDIKNRLDREFHVNTYWHSQTFLFHKRAGRWFPIIERILQEQDVPDDFKYLCLIESGLDNVVSPAGAAGFWQFMKSTGRGYQLEINEEIDERYNIEKSTKSACKYLKIAKKKFGSWTLAAASYNMGKSGLQKRLTEQKTDSYYDLHLNSETSRYVMRIIAAKYILSESEYYGFRLRDADIYKPYDVKNITIDSTILNLVDFAIEHNISFRSLKVLNPWLRGRSLHVTGGKSYEIKLPTGGAELKEKILEEKDD
jgi:membrane-bound lytic murein transglycosylase D